MSFQTSSFRSNLTEQLKKLASRGVELDDEALEQLDLLELGLIRYPDLEDITQEQLNRLYGQTGIIRSAAQTVNRVLTVDCAKNLMELLHYLSRAIFNSMVHYTITVDEVSREMLTQVTSIHDFCLKVGEEKRQVSMLRHLTGTYRRHAIQ